jgi:predicted O-linked N-acetylglucosamine transferase (SPINDLY family)
LWSKILINLKDSKIFLKNPQFDSLELRNIIKKKFLEFGVLEKNIILEGTSKRIDLLNCYNKIDIALDTFPYGGGTTSLEAASMCVPILTKAGNSFLSRCGGSVNINLGLSDWVCMDDNEFFKKALKFSNKELLNSIKFKLKRDKNNFPIFNSKNLAKELVSSIKVILDKKSN